MTRPTPGTPTFPTTISATRPRSPRRSCSSPGTKTTSSRERTCFATSSSRRSRRACMSSRCCPVTGTSIRSSSRTRMSTCSRRSWTSSSGRRPEVAGSEHADAVVVGSGFGGSVAAYRLAEAGLSVVLMERGQAYPPGGFARTPAQMGRAFWDPSEGLYGLFDVWSFGGFDSVVASGLGGGSLIYANVLLRKDEKWFVHEEPLPEGGYESWPVTRKDLDPHYDAVESMLTPSAYPLDRPAYKDTAKTHAMQDAAAELGLDWQLPPLAVSFAPERGAEPRARPAIVP